jgi:hypothetical protein
MRSSAARYLIAVLAGALLGVPLVCLATWLAISRGLVDLPDLEIYYHHRAKIEAAREVDLLLIGDSTLGNTIDAGVWSARTGRAVLAVPLTGGYGYAGSLNMLRRVLRRDRPEVVVVMQSLDMATRNISWEGLLFTAERPSDLSGLPPWRLVRSLARVDILQTVLGEDEWPEAPLARLDYWPQAPAEQARGRLVATEPPTRAELRPEKFRYLRAIGEICRARQITCLYAHGPYLEPHCSRATDYLRAVNARVEASGLRVVPGTPRCMPLDQAGDAADHVRPALKGAFSEHYRALIAETLASDAAASSFTRPRSRGVAGGGAS